MREMCTRGQGLDGNPSGGQAALALCWTGLFNQNFSMSVGFTKYRILIWKCFRTVIRDALKRKTTPVLAVLGADQCPCFPPKWGKNTPNLSPFGRSQESSPWQGGFASLRAAHRSQEGAGVAGVILVSIWKPSSRPCHNRIKVFP